MNHQKLLLSVSSLTLIALLVIACGASTIPSASAPPTATHTPEPPTVMPMGGVQDGEMIVLEDSESIWIAEQEQTTELTVDEKIQSWIGERVIFLPVAIDGLTIGDYSSNPANNTCPTGWNEDPYTYAGKTGEVIDAQAGEYEPELLVKLDDSDETVSLCSTNGLGFFSEMEFAKSLIGQELWSKKRFDLASTCPVTQDIENAYTTMEDTHSYEHTFDKYETTISLVTKVIVTRVEWGIAVPGEWLRDYPDLGERPIVLYFETEDGGEYCTYSSKQYFVDRFHPVVGYSGLRMYTSDFYLEDPFEKHPSWNQEILDLIRQGEIATGMTLEMALVAGGGELRKEGFDISSGSTGLILKTTIRPYKTFVVEDGKVTKVVSSQ